MGSGWVGVKVWSSNLVFLDYIHSGKGQWLAMRGPQKAWSLGASKEGPKTEQYISHGLVPNPAYSATPVTLVTRVASGG